MTDPLVTVGMFVRNGERTIEAAIESFRAQTMRRFVLNVHDNASTDQTAQIVQRIARHDDRVRLIRKSRNLGAVRNCIEAASDISTPMFCWAACDDLREPGFLHELKSLLDAHPSANLACCAVRNMDPDGRPRDVRPETDSLRTTVNMRPAARLRMYLKRMPGTPFYGLFRGAALPPLVSLLERLDSRTGEGQVVLGVDMIVLAELLRTSDIACTREPLLLFRRGGMSHNVGRYGSLGAFVRQLRTFQSEFARACRIDSLAPARKASLQAARHAAVLRWLTSRDMRAMTAHYIRLATPGLQGLLGFARSRWNGELRRLRRRVHQHSAASPRIVLFGAGKHTRRRLNDLQRAVRGRGEIIAVCDDHAVECQPIAGLTVITPAELATLDPDIIMVSSDTYEASMYARARAIAPRTAAVWCLYDRSLEASECTACPTVESTDATNAAISSHASPALSR